MLILTRRVGQAIRIAEAVRIVILAAHGNKVQLGIAAPAGVKVWRDELYRREHASEESPSE